MSETLTPRQHIAALIINGILAGRRASMRRYDNAEMVAEALKIGDMLIAATAPRHGLDTPDATMEGT